MDEKNRESEKDFSIGSIIIRIIVSAIVIGIAAFFTPGFSIEGLTPLLIAAVVIGLLDYLIERFTGIDASPFGRGITGFLVSVAILYLTGLFVEGVGISLFGAIIAALAIGIFDMIIPGKKVM